MKTRKKLFIISPVIVAIIIFTIIFLYIDSFTEYDRPMPAIFIPYCEFMENISELDPCSSSSKMFELQLVLDNCETQRKFATGEIPEINADGSINYMFGDEYHFQNSTHYIDNHNCEWRELEYNP